MQGILIVDFRVEVDGRQGGSQPAMESHLPLLHQNVLDDGQQIHDAQALSPVNQRRPQVLSRHRRPNMRMTACGRLRKCLIQILDMRTCGKARFTKSLNIQMIHMSGVYIYIYIYIYVPTATITYFFMVEYKKPGCFDVPQKKHVS